MCWFDLEPLLTLDVNGDVPVKIKHKNRKSKVHDWALRDSLMEHFLQGIAPFCMLGQCLPRKVDFLFY